MCTPYPELVLTSVIYIEKALKGTEIVYVSTGISYYPCSYKRCSAVFITKIQLFQRRSNRLFRRFIESGPTMFRGPPKGIRADLFKSYPCTEPKFSPEHWPKSLYTSQKILSLARLARPKNSYIHIHFKSSTLERRKH